MSANCTDVMSQLLRELTSEGTDYSSSISEEAAGISQKMIGGGGGGGGGGGATCGDILLEGEDNNGDSCSTSNRSGGFNLMELSSEADLFDATASAAASSGLFYRLKRPRQGRGRRLAAFDPLSDDRLFASIVLPCSAMPPSAAVIVSSLPSCELATLTSWDNSSRSNNNNNNNSTNNSNTNNATTSLAAEAENATSDRSNLDAAVASPACVSTDGDDCYVTPPETLIASSCAVQILGSTTPSPSESKRRRIAADRERVKEEGEGEVGDLADEDRRRRSRWLRRLLEHPLLAIGGATDLRLAGDIKAVIEADLAAADVGLV